MSALPPFFDFKGLLFLGLLVPIAAIDLFFRREGERVYIFSYLIGSAIACVMFAFVYLTTFPAFKGNPFVLALGIILVIGLWRFLFGPWGAEVKAVVLGTFIFWIAVRMLDQASTSLRTATVLAAIIALIPSIIWCLLFLKEHRERMSVVVLTFFAGMLSTAPILFYDYVVKKGFTLDFFLFRITPESFMRSSQTFASQALTGQLGILSTSTAAAIVSFIIVGIIEETSKNWVMRASDRAYFTSIDDVLQLSIIAAIGFAFAENIVNPQYFISFVRDYLVTPATPDWGTFIASIFGRSVITNMVHITSSGVLGYCYGLAFFAQPFLVEERAYGHKHRTLSALHKLFRVRRARLFQDHVIFRGLLLAILLHSFFNIIVSAGDLLPGQPQTLGALFGFSGVFSNLSIVSIPAMLYVFGGWFLLLFLFRKKTGLQEYGHKMHEELFVREGAAA
jgi:hypothetical protein